MTQHVTTNPTQKNPALIIKWIFVVIAFVVLCGWTFKGCTSNKEQELRGLEVADKRNRLGIETKAVRPTVNTPPIATSVPTARLDSPDKKAGTPKIGIDFRNYPAGVYSSKWYNLEKDKWAIFEIVHTGYRAPEWKIEIEPADGRSHAGFEIEPRRADGQPIRSPYAGNTGDEEFRFNFSQNNYPTQFAVKTDGSRIRIRFTVTIR